MPIELALAEIANLGKAHDAHMKALAKLVTSAAKLEADAATLRDDLVALLPDSIITNGGKNGGPPREKAKTRKAVTAPPKDIETVRDTLKAINHPVTVKQLRGATGLGPKVIGAALRQLVSECDQRGPEAPPHVESLLGGKFLFINGGE